MRNADLWPIVAKRVKRTIQQVEDGDFSESLIHLATVYGILSIAYYKDDQSLVSDGQYDALCKHLLNNFDEAMDQGTYSTILNKEALQAGTGYHLANVDSLPGSAQTLHAIYYAMGRMEPAKRTPVKATRKRSRPVKGPVVRKRTRPVAPPVVRKRTRPVRAKDT